MPEKQVPEKQVPEKQVPEKQVTASHGAKKIVSQVFDSSMFVHTLITIDI